MQARLLASVLGALVAWLVTGTHVASTLHFALVSHQICAAHGEVEHTPEAHATHAAAVESHAAYQSAGDEAEHHHCSLLGAPREQLALAPSARCAIAPAPRALTPFVPSAHAAAPDRADLLLIAPKQSPPV